jgi:hypothetical protein
MVIRRGTDGYVFIDFLTSIKLRDLDVEDQGVPVISLESLEDDSEPDTVEDEMSKGRDR